MRLSVTGLSISILLAASVAAAGTTVTGDSNPNLAGRADGYSCCGGDAFPAQAPLEMTEVEFGSCDLLYFAASGRVSFTPSVGSGNNPDGDSLFGMTNFGDGISAPPSVRANALVGVFLDDASPTGQATPPPLEVTEPPDFYELSPDVGQIFFIGDGTRSDTKLGDSLGQIQYFHVPNGATRLFFGTTDGSGWFNNSGTFSVTTSRFPNPSAARCADPVSPEGVTASDALYVLRSAVGTAECPDCVCDADRSGAIAATDALAVLRKAVGQGTRLRCACCPPSS